MREEKSNQEEREPGGEIILPASGGTHGKVYRWLDNFWYHHKWKTLIILFFVVVFIVCTVQMCSKESDKCDVMVVCAGPYGFSTNGEGLNQLQNLLAHYLPEDFNHDGERRVSVVSYTVYSQEQLQAMSTEEANIVSYSNSANYESFYQNLSAGEFSVAFVDPFLYEELASRSECLIDIKTAFDLAPENGLYKTNADGSIACYGIRLGDSALYQQTAFRVLPEDTVLCLVGSVYFGNDAEYANSLAYFRSLLSEN